MASAKIAKAKAPATFQFVDRAIVNSDGKLTAGPAIIIATAAPAGAPADSRSNASGISKNVGIAKGTAINDTTLGANIRPRPDASNATGSHISSAIDSK